MFGVKMEKQDPAPRTPNKRSSLKFKENSSTTPDVTNASSSSISDTTPASPLENSKKNAKGHQKKNPKSGSAPSSSEKVSRSASAPLAKFNAQRLGSSPQGRRDAAASGTEVTVANPLFNTPSKARLAGMSHALASSSPTIAPSATAEQGKIN